MKCPKCEAQTDVVDSREATGDYLGVRRRRECPKCKHRFSTMEVLASNDGGHSLVPVCVRREPVKLLVTVTDLGKVLISEVKG